MTNTVKATSYIPQLDGVRALAALLVMYFHFFQAYPQTGSLLVNIIQKTSVFGQTGVSLFFVLSGFLITRILIVAKNEPNYFKNFYAKRVLRIFPLYYAFLFIYYFIVLSYISSVDYSIKDVLIYSTYLQNVYTTFSKAVIAGPGHFWSLAVEEHFYLFWPLWVYITPVKYLVKSIIGLISISIICRFFLLNNGYDVFYFTFSRLDDICIGSLLAVVWIRYPDMLKYMRGARFILVFLLFIIATICLWSVTSGHANEYIQLIKYPIISVFYMLLIANLISSKSFLAVSLSYSPIVYLGKISYGLYVFHPLCYFLIDHYYKVPNIWASLIINILATVLIASVSYELFEKRFLKLKKYFSPKGIDNANDKAAI